MARTVVATESAPAAIGPYSQGLVVDCPKLVFVSGQLPADPQTGEFAGDTIAEQTRQSLDNVQAVLVAAGVSMRSVVKTTVFLQDMGDFAAMNEVYQQYFSEPYPCRAAIEAAKLPKGARVEIEAMAVLE